MAKNALMAPNEYGIVRNAQGEVQPMLSKWTPGSWTGTWTNTAETGGDPTNGGAQLPMLGALPEDFWQQQGFQGQAYTPRTGGAEDDMALGAATPELEAWAAANGYAPGNTEGYGGILKNGQIVDGSYFGNRSNDDAMFYATMLGLGGVGAYANAAGIGVDAAGNATGGAFGSGASSGGAATEGASPYVMSSADKAAIYGAEGYGAGMTGAETAAYASGAGTTAGNTMGNKAGTSLADFFSGNGNMNDYLRAGQGLYGLYTQNKAADAAQQGNQQQMNLLTRMYDQNRADNQPLLDMRNSVLPKIQGLINNPSSITQDPGYQFGLNQGQRQIENQQAARGGYYSGQQLKASQKFGQDYAGTKLDQSLNRLMGVATGSQVGAQNNQQNSNNFGMSGGNALQQGGNIRAGGYLGQQATVNNGINGWLQDQYDRKYWGGGP